MSKLKRFKAEGKLPKPLSPYTAAVQGGPILWISGMMAMDINRKIVSPDDVVGQTEKVFENIKAVLDEAGGTFDDITMITIYLTNIEHRTLINSVRLKYFGESRPAGTLVEVSRLADPQALIEIDAVAYLG